jgi:DNA-binding winged helix-turn-helix (wHTH) protein
VVSRFRSGNTVIDLEAREIRRNGRAVEVEAKAFDLIALLLAHRGQALDKRTLNAALWGDRPVTDAALSQQVRKARRALGDDGTAQQVILTVHGHGLRWIAPVEEEPDPDVTGPAPAQPLQTTGVSAPSRRKRRWPFIVAACALALAAAGLGAWMIRGQMPVAADLPLRVAILPLEDRTGDASLAWTSAGLTGLMGNLIGARAPFEQVAAQNVRAAVPAAPDALDPGHVDRLRHALGASHLVATRLSRVGSLYRLDVRLLGAGAAGHAETLHGTAPALLAVQAARHVARWLGAPVPGPTGQRGIDDPFLAQAYARGVDAQSRGDFANARKYFAICLEQNPDLAWARMGLAIAEGETGDSAKSAVDARTVVAVARESGDDELLVAALTQVASVAFRRGNLDQAAALIADAGKDVGANRPLALTRLLVAQASIEDERGHAGIARSRYGQALALAKASGNRRGAALVLVNLAALDNARGDAAGAATLLTRGLEAAREADDTALEGSILANLGATAANRGHMLDAITLLEQGLDIARASSDSHLEALASLQLIWALEPFERADAIARLAGRVRGLAANEHNEYWQAELDWALGAFAAQRHAWPEALDHYARARRVYQRQDHDRRLAPLLADTIAAASGAGLAGPAHQAAAAFRSVAARAPATWDGWLPLIDAELQAVNGDPGGARTALAALLDRAGGAGGPVAQASLFQLGRWQLDAGQPAALLARAEWKPWLSQHPEAIRLHQAALRALGRRAEAEAAGRRLDALDQAVAKQLAASPPVPGQVRAAR